MNLLATWNYMKYLKNNDMIQDFKMDLKNNRCLVIPKATPKWIDINITVTGTNNLDS